MVIQFPDETEATLPLPSDYGFVTYLPTSQSFSENTFIYEIAEDTRTYRYTVNLQAKTVSLNVI